MKTINFERSQIEAAYDEIERRLCDFIRVDNPTRTEVRDELSAMMQGAYSVFSVLASNWPEVRHWIDEIEENRTLWLEV